ncbi:MAG: oxidoreductase [Deltaproteobacteria bacterium]|nr:oxidoreductase [Deltaproteobacteria bacterium]
MTHGLVERLALIAAAAPAALFLALGACAIARYALSEKTVGRMTRGTFLVTFLCNVAVAALMAAQHRTLVVIPLGDWFSLPGYRFTFELILDRLSVPFALFSQALIGVVGAFANRYVHKERGFNRFFTLLALFATGMNLIILAGGIEIAFAGWELVGLSSALLIAFFHDRRLAVENGFRALVVYRVCDAGFLVAAVLIRHWAGSGDFVHLFGHVAWPGGVAPLAGGRAAVIMLLIVVAVMGKCAQVPFSGWLPRAMEGPTPSSAIFYGALSVHAGVYLLLRFAPLLSATHLAAALLAVVALVTAVVATTVGRVQTDIKSSLAFASLTQVSIILLEVAAGLYWLAIAHTVGHMCVRSLQFLRAPSLLHDIHNVENALGGHLASTGQHYRRMLASPVQSGLYRFALERAHLDAALDSFIVRPFVGLFQALDRVEQRIAILLDGSSSRSTRRDDPTGSDR